MSFLVAIVIVVLLGAVILVVSAPLRRARDPQAPASDVSVSARMPARLELESTRERDELEAARAAKYREIRDTELDYRTGKLSPQDYQAIDGDLRGEALEILDRLERLDGPTT